MRCQRCGKPITPLRQLTDREFCCEEHRKRGPLASASAFRDHDAEDILWLEEGNAEKKKANGKMATSLALVMLLIVGGLVAARMWMPESAVGGISPLAASLHDTSPAVGGPGAPPADGPSAQFMNWLEDRLPGEKPVRVRSEFGRGLTAWTGELRRGSRLPAWSIRDGVARPGALRLWKPTLRSRDYDLRFLGEIDRKAMSWTFRSTDSDNYYATRLSIGRPGDPNGSVLTRIIVQGAKTVARVELPMPVHLHPKRPYQLTVSVRGDSFLTLLDGSIIDDWTDRTFGAGGIGFYSEPGESASLHWVDFRERKGLLAKFLTTAFFFPPGMPVDGF